MVKKNRSRALWLSRFQMRFPSLFGLRLRKAKSLYFVTINGQRFKRVRLADSTIAADIEHNLEVFHADDIFPRLVTRYEHEIWVDFITGDRLGVVTEKLVRQVADFYATIYTKRTELVNTADTLFPARLAQDIRFLNQVGILSGSLYERLCLAFEPLTPQQVWLGFDYIDPVLKNFVASEEGGQLYAVDVEGIADDQLVGMGTIKACVRWLGEFQPLFYEHLASQGAPDFQLYLPFVQLCFLAKWTKRNFFEGKKNKIDARMFEKFCER